MNDNSPSAEDLFGAIADEFVEAFRQGKRPSPGDDGAGIARDSTSHSLFDSVPTMIRVANSSGCC
jgi:hypothetical protein